MTISASGTDISVTANGTTSTRPAAEVSSINITGADSLTVNGASSNWTLAGGGAGSVSAANIPGVNFTGVSSIAGAGAADTLTGPAADTTWTIAGADAGQVAGVSFTGFEDLTGAANNNDTFVIAPGGTLSGTIGGSAAGFDTLRIDGARGSVSTDATSASSGTVVVDGATFRYTGLEPILIESAAEVTVTGTTGDDTITLSPHATVATKLVAAGPGMESVEFTIPTTSLTVNGGDGADTVVLSGTLSLPGVILLVTAEQIQVTALANVNTTTGSITLAAASTPTARDLRAS